MSNEELAVLAQQGDKQALWALWERVKRLLHQMARRFYRRYGAECCARHGVTLADLEQEAFFALLDAVRGFQPERGWRFTTYLTWASENRFRACMGLRKVNPLDMADSLNAPALDDGESKVEIGDLIPDPKAAGAVETIDAASAAEYYRRELEAGLAGLSSIRVRSLVARYYQAQTYPQIALVLGITPADVRREISNGLRELRANERIQQLVEEFIAGNAYKHTSFTAWKYGGSVEEWMVERQE